MKKRRSQKQKFFCRLPRLSAVCQQLQQMPRRSQNLFTALLSQCWHLHTASTNVRNVEMKRGHLHAVPNLFNSSKSMRSQHRPTRLYDLRGFQRFALQVWIGMSWLRKHIVRNPTRRRAAAFREYLLLPSAGWKNLLLLWRWETVGSYVHVDSSGLTCTILRSAHTVYLFVLCESGNKQR